MKHGLLIKTPFIDWILNGQKTWEIRGTKTKIRGEIYLIRSGSGKIVGKCKIIDVRGPLTLREFHNNKSKHLSSLNILPYKTTFAWILKDVKIFKNPVSYKHPLGAIIWVKL